MIQDYRTPQCGMLFNYNILHTEKKKDRDFLVYTYKKGIHNKSLRSEGDYLTTIQSYLNTSRQTA